MVQISSVGKMIKDISEKVIKEFTEWESPDGNYKIIGTEGKQGNAILFKVTCKICSQDPELFPDGYFVSTKYNLLNGIKPCGCGKNVRWEPFQYLILTRRAAKDRFIVHGFAEEFHGNTTKLNLECLKDGNKWTASISSVISSGTGCPKCSNKYRPTEQEALQKCIDICKEMDYDDIGFVDGYKGAIKTVFRYKCPKHGIQETNYNNFVNNRRRCKECWKEKQKELGENNNGNGYYPERKYEQDYLYVLNFDDKYIKVGRSFDVDERIKDLRKPRCSGIKNILKLRIFTATHQEIYDFEQELHEILRQQNFQHRLHWTNECFDTECRRVLNKELDKCNYSELQLYN